MPSLRYGEEFTNPPVPHLPANTLLFPAGPLSIGVEYRTLSQEILAAVYGAERAATIMAERFDAAPASASEPIAGGISIHVFDAATGVEHLRFDDLAGKQHYHYLRADGSHTLVWFDPVANGDLVPWALASLAERAADMLAVAGAGELADRVDRAALEAALVEAGAAAQTGLVATG
ncbi:DUF7700 domain-containing protein [Pseudonocardia sp. GCM10023141]|uniref:DUF7700 domain-containing protein n=1 Tax=Pseudonocardia sp. GCM10023141 TaxID=3252653 RepID=UPI0036100D0E